MGCFCSDLRIDPDTYQPDFYLQKGEEVIYTLKCTKRGINPLMAAILTVITLGLFLFFKDSCKKVRSVEVIVLTNKRVMEWEYKVPRSKNHPHATFQHFYNLCDMVYYQHEIVQDAALCFGLCKFKPFNTMRIFFNKYPTVTPPSYNNSPSMKPCLSDALSVANITKNTIVNGIAQNWIGLAINLFQLIFRIIGIVSKLFTPNRPEVLLPGHYLELDTNDKGSTQNVLTFLQYLNNVYPRKGVLRGPVREGVVELQNEDLSLFDKHDGPVRLNPTYLQLGREEAVFDATTYRTRVTIWDWILAVVTFGIYYLLVIRDLKNYKGGLVITDRRFITIFTHNHHGFKPDVKYVQLVNCWFFTKMNSAAVVTTRPNNCFTACCEPTWRTLYVDCGPGSLAITPSFENESERINSLFSKFFSYRSRPLLQSIPVDFKETNEVGLPNHFRIQGEVLLYDLATATPHDCAFTCTRLLSCGFEPPHITHDIGISTHRLYVKYTISNAHYKDYYQMDFFTRLENVHGLELSELYAKACCCEVKQAHVGICFRNDPDWTLSMWIRKADLHSDIIRQAGQAISYVQTVIEDVEEAHMNAIYNAAPGAYVQPIYYQPGPSGAGPSGGISVTVQQP